MEKAENVNAQYLLNNLSIGASDKGITHITFIQDESKKTPTYETPEIKTAYKQVKEYLEGKKKVFSLKLDFSGLTEFHQKVYEEAMKIPFGETRSYGWLAKKTGRERAGRAVGSAMAKNPFLLVMPCHRVLRSDGSLGGFGPGLEWKTFLLNLEKQYR